jgi:hypothetical protein
VVEAMMLPMASSGKSSSFLKRTHDFPMSGFFPAFLNASFRMASLPM